MLPSRTVSPMAVGAPAAAGPRTCREPPGLFALYPHLQETPLAEPRQRTEWNVRDADRLMVLIDRTGMKVSKGTEAARDLAVRLGKPCIVLDLDAGDALDRALAFLGEGDRASASASPARAKARRRASTPRRARFCANFSKRLGSWDVGGPLRPRHQTRRETSSPKPGHFSVRCLSLTSANPAWTGRRRPREA